MIFEQHQTYHIYNQGNNNQKIFFSRENYLYFLKKLSIYIQPHADILAWCLMPNHFHLMVYVHTLEIAKRDSLSSREAIIVQKPTGIETDGVTPNKVTVMPTDGVTSSKVTVMATDGVTLSHPVSKRSLNDSIAIILRSYTRAINLMYNRSGSLFREETKAECLTKTKGITPSFYNTFHGAVMKTGDSEKEYPQVCFNYIHLNPKAAGLVDNVEEWEFSSYMDYLGFRKGKLINKKRAEESGLTIN